MKAKNPGALSGRTWTSILLFGLIGQIAWVVENMYFSRFMQNEITRAPYATTLMVAFSALFATLSTLLGGAICDRTGKRKVFITWGYVIWGFTIMAFALIPMQPAPDKVKAMVILVVVMDCVMSVIGSISNDASFNTWITDMTNTANRSKVDTILAVLPLLAIAVVFVGFDGLTNAAATTDDWKKFFMLLGIIPTVGGLIGVFLMKDKPGLQKKTDGNFLADFVYSLNPKVIKENKLLYVCLSGNMVAAIAYQIYVNYLFNIIEGTLQIKDYIVPVAIIGLAAAVGSVLVSTAMDKVGKKHFFYLKAELAILIVGGILVIGVTLVMAGLFTASYRDCIPKGREGLFQGCRMVLYVLVPMIIGPLIAQFIINQYNKGVTDSADIVYPMELFLGAAAVMVFCFIPASVVRKKQDAVHEKLLEEMKEEQTKASAK